MAEGQQPQKITPIMLKMQETDVGKRLFRSESNASAISSRGRNPIPESPTVRSPGKLKAERSPFSSFHQEIPEPGMQCAINVFIESL